MKGSIAISRSSLRGALERAVSNAMVSGMEGQCIPIVLHEESGEVDYLEWQSYDEMVGKEDGFCIFQVTPWALRDVHPDNKGGYENHEVRESIQSRVDDIAVDIMSTGYPTATIDGTEYVSFYYTR